MIYINKRIKLLFDDIFYVSVSLLVQAIPQLKLYYVTYILFRKIHGSVHITFLGQWSSVWYCIRQGMTVFTYLTFFYFVT